jgi:hypothetical protein
MLSDSVRRFTCYCGNVKTNEVIYFALLYENIRALTVNLIEHSVLGVTDPLNGIATCVFRAYAVRF